MLELRESREVLKGEAAALLSEEPRDVCYGLLGDVVPLGSTRISRGCGFFEEGVLGRRGGFVGSVG